MNSKGFVVLGGLTVAAVVAASMSLSGDGGASAADSPALFPDLLDRINEVARIEVVTEEESYTVTRGEDGWGLASKGGFPVKRENVTQLAIGLANLERFEEKTSNPAYYPRLGVADVAADVGDEGVASKRVTLSDDSGNVLADVLLGKSEPGASALYARVPGEETSWLCNGDVTVTPSSTAWLDKEILQVQRDRIAGTTLTHADGVTLDVSRESADENTYAFAEVPEGRELSNASAGNALGTVLTYLSFDDVKSADEIDFDVEEAWQLECRTFDGLVVSADLVEVDGTTWARFQADYEEGPALDVGPAPAEEEGEEGAEAGADAEEETGPTPEEVRAEAAELSERLAPWAYALPSYKAQTLKKRMEDFLSPLEEETADEGAAAE